MRIRTAMAATMFSLSLTGCTVASSWSDMLPEPGWVGIETQNSDTKLMFSCRIPTEGGRGGTYSIRIKTTKAPKPLQIIRISRLRDTLAVTLVLEPLQNGYYISPINEDEATAIFASIRQSGGITVESEDWIFIEVAVPAEEVSRLDSFLARCKN